tara:strand:- start:1143 stop:2015 length:873 start_codon:yes stop_codon:yes gene_type:complete
MAQINIFPNPVLGVDGDFLNSKLKIEHIQVKGSKGGYWTFKVLPIVEDSFILSLINNKKASMILIVKCNNTMYRKQIELESSEEKEFNISTKKVYGEVNLHVLIVMNVEGEYSFEDLNSDFYDDSNFYLNTNDVIGKSIEWTTKLWPPFVKDTPIQHGRLWSFKKEDGLEYARYDLSDPNQIIIRVPTEDYLRYKQISDPKRGDLRYQKVFKMLYLFPVLMEILKIYSSDKESLAITNWFKMFDKLCDDLEITGDNPYEEAQKIIKEQMSGNDSYKTIWNTLIDLREGDN